MTTDLDGTAERRSTVVLALLVLAVLLMPVASGAQVSRPGSEAGAEATPTPMPAVPAEEVVDPAAEQVEAVVGGDDADPAPAPTPTPTPTPSEDAADLDGSADGGSGADGGTVQAEGSGAQEVVEAPQAPPAGASGGGEATDPAAGADVAAASGEPAGDTALVDGTTLDPALEGLQPAPAISYGVSVVPSLGTAVRSVGDPYAGAAPQVLAPLVAGGGQQVKVGATATTFDKAAFLRAAEPARDVAAVSLSIVTPSWYATSMALLVLLGAASYGAVLRRRGVEVPAAIAFTSAVRPGDHRVSSVRSVRPTDLQRSARSVRP